MARPWWIPEQPVYGIVIDRVVYPLQGQPAPAVTHGWGNLSFLYFQGPQ